MESFPVWMLVSVFSCCLIGMVGQESLQLYKQRERLVSAVREFNEFLGAVDGACSKGRASFCLQQARLQISGRVAVLLVEGEPRRSEQLPVPFSENLQLGPGKYEIRLVDEGGWVLHVEER